MPNTEIKHFTLDDISIKPDYFDTDLDGHARLSLVDMYGMLFPEGTDQKPIWWIRHCNPDSIRFGGFFEPGDGCLSLQKQKHMMDIAQKTAKVNKYRRIDETCWGIDCEYPFFEYRFYEDHFTFKETDVMDIVAKPFDRAIFKHADDSMITSQITIPCTFEGTYEGKPVTGMGNFELMYLPQTEKRELNDFFSYIYSYGLGIRPDGKKEVYMVSANLEGNNHGFYWLEGEEPVMTSECKIDIEWIRLPYMDDGTCTYRDAVFYIGEKEVHFTGKWGNKGITPWPRVELNGQSQNNGTWYEGKESYVHSNYLIFNENMDVYDYKLEKAGFKVIDPE